jgi:hypothetical protein
MQTANRPADAARPAVASPAMHTTMFMLLATVYQLMQRKEQLRMLLVLLEV